MVESYKRQVCTYLLLLTTITRSLHRFTIQRPRLSITCVSLEYHLGISVVSAKYHLGTDPKGDIENFPRLRDYELCAGAKIFRTELKCGTHNDIVELLALTITWLWRLLLADADAFGAVHTGADEVASRVRT